MIKNSNLADADEVIALQKYALISAGQNFINAMKVASPHTDYTFIKGRHFACNQGNLCFCDKFNFSQLNSRFQVINYCDTFATLGCYTSLNPMCSIWVYCGNDASTSVIEGNIFCSCHCAIGCNSTKRCLYDTNLYADYYQATYCLYASASYCCGTSVATCFGNFLIESCGGSPSSLSCKKVEFIKVPGTFSCYCFILNNCLQCCIDVCMTNYSILARAQTNCVNGGSCSFIKFYSPYISCYTDTKPYIETYDLIYANAPGLVIATGLEKDADNLIYANLTCSDGTCLSCFKLGTVLDLSSYNLCTYKAKIFPPIINNCDCGCKMPGFALSEFSRSPTL
jgi:hypothetical protein